MAPSAAFNCISRARALLAVLLAATGLSAAASDRALKDLPAPAQARISEAIGRHQPAYFARAFAPGFSMTNPRQGLSAAFTSAGLHITSGDLRPRFTLLAYGFGEELTSAQEVTPHASANRVEYRRDGLTEWYVNGPLGLEQGFDLAEAPAGDPREPLTFSFSVTGLGRPVLDDDGRNVRFADTNLAYGGLWAVDATGRELPAWMELRGDSLLLRVGALRAVYPVTVDPLFTAATLTVERTDSSGKLGADVAIAGNVIAVGAPETGGAGYWDPASAGAIYVFVKPANGWGNITQSAKLTASDPITSNLLGSSIAMHDDVIVGSSRHGIYVFAKPPGGWTDMTQSAKLTRSDRFPLTEQLIGDLAIHGDAIAAQAHYEVVRGFFRPRVFLWTKTEFGWVSGHESLQLNMPVPVPGLGPIAISGDALVAGDPAFDIVFAWNKSAAGWLSLSESSAPAKLTPSDYPSFRFTMRFGADIALSGNSLAVGAPWRGWTGESFVLDGEGGVYYFEKPPGGWIDAHESQRLRPLVAWAHDSMGAHVAIDGDRVVASGAMVGATSPWEYGQVNNSGIYLFRPSAGAFEMMKFKTYSGIGSLAIQGDNIVIGDPAAFPVNNFSRGQAIVLLNDVTAPTSRIEFVPASPDGDNGWHIHPVQFKVSAQDEARGSRIWGVWCALDPPAVPADFNDLSRCWGTYTNGTFVGDLQPVTSDGQHTVYFTSRDVAGNFEQIHSAAFKLDATPPAAAINVSPAPDGNNGWHRSNPLVTVSATDGVGSGVASIACVLDPATPPASFAQIPGPCLYGGTGNLVPAEGLHVVHAAARDNAGLVSPVASHGFRLDKTAPVVTCASTPTFLLRGAGTLSALVSDALSGPAADRVSAPADTSSAGHRTRSLVGSDLAGNTAAAECGYRVAFVLQGPFAPFPLSAYVPGSKIQLRFALADATNARVTATEAAAVAAACGARVALDNATPGCAAYESHANVFSYTLEIPRSTPSGTHHVNIRVLVGDEEVNALTVPVNVR